ncbi:DUF7289 family protein [Halorubrum vacuolatum]|uniref:Flagellin N-terminal-like domain-containing protein n=1 Tax=Halorubrum vacuolatum TaxID=63740 RepID=A0A238X2S3_HALVU|nr:hypothetical protein [Halorubrum vacuolatum]SNR53256.1 hypothetical protein SAMN06264855_11313 [Halorubrum vacuolatum]
MSDCRRGTIGRSRRAQSNVIGVALLVGLTMVSLGALTATVGTVVDSNAAVGDVDRVASDLDRAIDPVESIGTGTGRVTYTEGTLRTEMRTVRVFRDDDLVVSRETEAIVYERGAYRVTAVGGAVIRDHAGSHSIARGPPVSASSEVVTIGVVALTATDVAIDGSGPTTRTLVSEVSHERIVDGESGEWTVAVETPEPDPWVRSFENVGATVYTGEFDDDEHQSVVATFEGDRRGHVVVHRVETEGRDG